MTDQAELRLAHGLVADDGLTTVVDAPRGRTGPSSVSAGCPSRSSFSTVAQISRWLLAACLEALEDVAETVLQPVPMPFPAAERGACGRLACFFFEMREERLVPCRGYDLGHLEKAGLGEPTR